MPEEPEGELDLSNLDALLSDLEKDLESGSSMASSPPAPSAPPDVKSPAPPPALPEPEEALAAPPDVKSPAPLTALPEPEEVRPEPPDEELLASPIPPGHKDESIDELEDMFTDEEESVSVVAGPVGSVEEIDEEQPTAAAPSSQPSVPETPVLETVSPSAPPSDPMVFSDETSAENLSFEDALELDEDSALSPAPPPPPPIAQLPGEPPPDLPGVPSPAGLPPPLKPGALPESLVEATLPPPGTKPSVAPTPDLFMRALKEKNYPRAAELGLQLRSRDSSAVFRQNLAGALFYADRSEEAEQELISLLEEFPYTISARRNLEIVRAK